MDLEKAAKRLERQLARRAFAKARLTFLWLHYNRGGVGRSALRVRRILREAPASPFVEHLVALSQVLGFLHPRNFKEGLQRLEALAQQGEAYSILFLAGRMARKERLDAPFKASRQAKDQMLQWLSPLPALGIGDAALLQELLRPLPTIDEVMTQQFPGQYLDALASSRAKAARKLIRRHQRERILLCGTQDIEGSESIDPESDEDRSASEDVKQTVEVEL